MGIDRLTWMVELMWTSGFRYTVRYNVCSVTKSYKYTSIIEIVSDLHWLSHPFENQLITYKAITFEKPSSLWNLLKIRDFPHGLHSTWAISLFKPFAGRLGTHAYTNFAPKLWNVLPESWSLLSHKALKTHYFNGPQNSNHNHSLSSMVIASSG